METSAKNNESIDDVFFRAVINCVEMNEDANNTSANESMFSSRRDRFSSGKQSGRLSARRSDKRFFYFDPEEDEVPSEYDREAKQQ